MSNAILVSVLDLEAIKEWLWNPFINSDLLISSAAALLVALTSFIGIMMFVSRLVKSTGALIGMAIFLVTDFFQRLIENLVTPAFGIQGGTVNFYKIAVGCANPAQFVALIDMYLTDTFQTSLFGIATGSFLSLQVRLA